jgi:hypothetical protein
MTFDDVKLIKHQRVSSKRFGYWVQFRDQSVQSAGRKKKLSIIRFLESNLGPLGTRWQYQKLDQHDYILKLNNEHDFLMLLLRFR